MNFPLYTYQRHGENRERQGLFWCALAPRARHRRAVTRLLEVRARHIGRRVAAEDRQSTLYYKMISRKQGKRGLPRGGCGPHEREGYQAAGGKRCVWRGDGMAKVIYSVLITKYLLCFPYCTFFAVPDSVRQLSGTYLLADGGMAMGQPRVNCTL